MRTFEDFKILDFLKENMIIAIAVAAAVLIILLVVIILAVKGSKRKQLRILENKYQTSKELLTGQDAQFVHRIETISHVNLSYGEVYERYSTGFRVLLDGDCKYIEGLFVQLHESLESKNKKSFKALLAETKKSCSAFKEKLASFDKELHLTIKPEEDSRNSAVIVKESFRNLKQRYLENAQQLESVAESFEKAFEKIDKTFAQFEEHLSRAEYNEANKIIPTLKTVITALDKAITQYPDLLAQIKVIIPGNISELGKEIARIEEGGTPVFDLCFPNKSSAWHNALADCEAKLKEFKSNGIADNLRIIQTEIDLTRKGLDQELLDKSFFEQNMNSIYENVISLEKTFLKLVAKLPELNGIYVIDKEQQYSFEVLKDYIDKLAIAKRDLDNFVHSTTKQPFTILKEKLDAVRNDYETALKGVNDFKAYIESIKNNCEEAHALILNYYYHLKEAERIIRDMNIPGYKESFRPSVDKCYVLLNEVDALLKAKPIDVNAVNAKVEILKQEAELLFKQVEGNYKKMALAESAIVFNNRDRLHQGDVNEKLKVLEGKFYECDFDRVYQLANELYQNRHVEDGRNGR